jgi:PPOX class probable F420-dependent enzyme
VVGDLLVTAVDHKPKGTTRLARLADIEASPRVSVLVDEYAEDWGQLWWARADGRAQVVAAYDVPDLLRELVNRYPQYADTPPTGPVIVVDVERWTGWSATGSAGSSGAG